MYGLYRDGTSRVIPLGVWSATAADIGGIRPTGRYTANGLVGGVTTVAVEIARDGGAPLRAQTTLRVRVSGSSSRRGRPPRSRRSAARSPADPARAVVLRYPLANAVMPQNVQPADVHRRTAPRATSTGSPSRSPTPS